MSSPEQQLGRPRYSRTWALWVAGTAVVVALVTVLLVRAQWHHHCESVNRDQHCGASELANLSR